MCTYTCSREGTPCARTPEGRPPAPCSPLQRALAFPRPRGEAPRLPPSLVRAFIDPAAGARAFPDQSERDERELRPILGRVAVKNPLQPRGVQTRRLRELAR